MQPYNMDWLAIAVYFAANLGIGTLLYEVRVGGWCSSSYRVEAWRVAGRYLAGGYNFWCRHAAGGDRTGLQPGDCRNQASVVSVYAICRQRGHPDRLASTFCLRELTRRLQV
jgi:hypothetical protein